MFVLYIYERRCGMATKTIYVPDEDLQVFDKAKEIAGDSLSAVVIQALKDFILKKEVEDGSFKEIKRWVGVENLDNNTIDGKYIRFHGRMLSEASKEFDVGHTFYFELFLTKKNQFFLYMVDENLAGGEVSSSYKPPFANIRDVMKCDVPAKLIIDAEKQMPGVLCEELDI
jgi:hypothetical protein